MAAGGRRVLVGGLAAAILALFAGHWAAGVLSDRWWAEAVDPAAAPFLTRWHLLGLLLELGGSAVAALWFVLQLLLVVGSISTVQVPRRLGNLEIRELLPLDRLRTGAIIAGVLLGILVGSDLDQALPLVLQGWRGVRYGMVDPVLGVDLGVYLAQLPLWTVALDFARRLVWLALAGAAVSHVLLGGVRVARTGVAMTDAARVQLGALVALALGLAAMGEGLGPLRAVAGLESGPVAALAPSVRWGVALAWGVAAVAIVLWVLRPAPGYVLAGLGLWVMSGALSRVVGHGAVPAGGLAMERRRPVAAIATGLERLHEERAPADTGLPGPPGPGLWSPEAVALLLQVNGGKLLGLAPTLVEHGGARVPAWLAVRRTGAEGELAMIAEDRLAAGGAPVTYRDLDPADYPGLVAWRHLDRSVLLPDQADTVAAWPGAGVPLGSSLRRVLLAWGTQTPGILGRPAGDASLFWRLTPRERAARLFPIAAWDEARPCLVGRTLYWVVDGWLLGAGAPLAPAIPWEGTTRRYARPAFLAVIDATTGTTRLYLHPGADALARGWAGSSDGAIAPPDSIPAEIAALPMSDLGMAVKGYAVSHGAYAVPPDAEGPASDSLLPRPLTLWTPDGPVAELAISPQTGVGQRSGRLTGVLVGGPDGSIRFIQWPAASAPLTSRRLQLEWQRFATYERLQDSMGASGGRLLPGPVRYEVGARGTLAVQLLYAVGATGSPSVAWVELARAERLGAARTPATALANLKGESAPLVPAPDLPDPLTEARHWAARADSLLRSGDLEGFGRAFGALKRVLGTP